MKTNFLLLTLDDMNYDSADFVRTEEKKRQLMPNLDRLKAEGMTFRESHVSIGLCQPSRSVLMSGKYPHCNGARGFENISPDVRTLTQILKEDGYFNGIIGKENHISPREQFCWDVYEHTYDDAGDFGRSPECYYQKVREFLSQSKEQEAPFFLMVNSHDPHRPFAGSEDEIEMFGRHIAYEEMFCEEDVKVPEFVPDLPDIRKEFAQYLNSVYRADQTVGQVMRALEEAGMEEDTMVWFLSDNGMSMPFAKANCYLNSTKSPYTVKWSGHIAPGSVSDALAASIDYMPTILEVAGLACPEDVDGKSLLPVLMEGLKEQYDDIYTSFYKTAKNNVTKRERYFPMRCVQNKQYAYIYNGWYGQEDKYRTETMAGLSFKAMEEAAKTDEAIAGRVEFYLNRVKEELYNYQKDPQALNNLAGEPEYRSLLKEMRVRMQEYMKQSRDELLDKFENDVMTEERS